MTRAFRRRAVTDAAGAQWSVGIRWLPRRPRWLGFGPGRTQRARGGGTDWLSGIDLGFEEGGLWILTIVAAVFLLWFVVLPVAVLLLDLLFVLLVAAGAVAARVLFHRPWIVEADGPAGPVRWPVVGWRRSQRAVDRVALALHEGQSLDAIGAQLARAERHRR